MSLFDYPRVNFKGTLVFNPGTANNDDYAQPGGGQALLPSKYGPYAGQPLALARSKLVEAQTYGMSDEEFIAWAQTEHEFDLEGGGTAKIVPAEWNYYGDMSTQAEARVVGVQAGPDKVLTQPDDEVALTGVLGSTLKFPGLLTDVNSEGSPPGTQFFVVDGLTLEGSETWISGVSVSKGVGQWLNFFRNVSLQQDDGSGTYVYHVMRGGHVRIPGFDGPGVVGVVMRYYIGLPRLTDPAYGNNKALEELYQRQGTSTKTGEIVGTLAPLLESETLLAAPAGRQLISRTQNIPTPGLNNNGAGKGVALAPAVLHQQGDLITADFVGTFPDHYDSKTNANPKYDFGAVYLIATAGGSSVTLAPVDYLNQAAGDARGWLFDFDISSNPAAQKLLADPNATFYLQSKKCGKVLEEVDYYVVSNQQGIYGEQGGPADVFINQGAPEHATISVYHRGRKLDAADCPPITVWQYRSVPIQAPGDAVPLTRDLRPGQPMEVDTSQPGNYLFTFSVEGETNPPPSEFPPENYGAFAYPPGAFVVTWAPQISLRLLPNGEDFSGYYVDPSAREPVGNDALTFDVVYEKVLRTYYLLYPAMNQVFPLNQEAAVRKAAAAILQVTDPKNWLSRRYMPRTRDLSQTRRTLLQAWCRKVSSH